MCTGHTLLAVLVSSVFIQPTQQEVPKHLQSEMDQALVEDTDELAGLDANGLFGMLAPNFNGKGLSGELFQEESRRFQQKQQQQLQQQLDDFSSNRERREYRTTTGPTLAYTPLGPFTTPATTNPPASTRSPDLPANLLEQYIFFPRSAIAMDGHTYYVNYNSSKTTLEDILAACYLDPTCVSFDYSESQEQGWTHRIPNLCAEAAGATYGRDSNSDFYQLKPEVLDKKGVYNYAWTANYTTIQDNLVGGLVTYLIDADRDKIDQLCNIYTAPPLGMPSGSEQAWLLSFGILLASLFSSGVISFVSVTVMARLLHRHNLNQVLNRNLRPGDEEIGAVDFMDDDDDDDGNNGHDSDSSYASSDEDGFAEGDLAVGPRVNRPLQRP